MAEPSVLILSRQDDVHSDLVGARLEELNTPYLRIDPGRVNETVTYRFESSRQVGAQCSTEIWEAERASIDLNAVRSILVRRISPLTPIRGASPEMRQFQAAETQSAIDGLMNPLANDRPWFNHPRANDLARDKVAQLRCAKSADLAVPPTIVTNDPASGRDFYQAHGRDIVVKSLSPAAPPSAVVAAIFTTKVPTNLRKDDWASLAAGSSILQARVEKSADVRVAVIGDRLLACRIDSQALEETSTDWRANGEALEHHPIEVPEFVAHGLRRLRRQLKLGMMHVDFCIDRFDIWWFLEANPNGQWLWLELNAGLDVSGAIAEQLTCPQQPLQQ